ncbi:Gypsy retrotransposon integrase-like protein 1 [Stygiomarasmius scandens]|uniref:Gypsy retrotransposon integrase-like protein 1 n=1 Tax=Marasmiellus scandens TaxID=2682957 RepID=A0ABR1JGA1_9AGAR
MRLAQERGVHRKGHNPGETKTEQELWRRTYWQLINIDIQASVFMGRPPAHMMEDHDLELPADCDDEYWEHPDPKQAFKQPPGRPCTMTAWILLLKLINIFAVAQRLVYPINGKRSQPSQEQEQIKQLDVALEKWLTSIPDYLHWDPKKPSSIFQDQSVSLFSLYAWVQMQIHRTFVRGKTSPHYSSLSLSSLARSTSAARACCQLLAVHQARGPIPLPHIQAVIFQSAIILMVHAWAAKRFSIASNYDDDIRDVARCSDALQYYENRWQLSGRMRDILQELLNKHSEQHRIQQPQPALRTNITQPVVDRAFTAIPHPKSSESSVPVQSEMYPVLQSHVGSVWPGSDTDYTSAFDTSLPAVNIQHPYSVPLPSSLMDTDMTQLTSEDLGFLNALGNIPGNQPLLGLDSGWSQWGAVEQNYGDQNYYQTWSNEPFGYMSEQT